MIIFHIVTPPLLAPRQQPIGDCSYVFYALHERTIFTMKGLHSKADSCFNQSWGWSEVTVRQYSRCVLPFQISARRQAQWLLQDKLLVPHLVKNFSAFYGTQRFITLFTTAHRSLYPQSDQSSPRPHSCSWNDNFNIILPSTPKSSTFLFPPDFPIKPMYATPSFPLRATFSVILRFLRGFSQSFRTNVQKFYKLGHQHFHFVSNTLFGNQKIVRSHMLSLQLLEKSLNKQTNNSNQWALCPIRR